MSEIPKNQRNEVKEEVGEFIVNAILDHVGESKSPVAGQGQFKALSKSYKKKKAGEASAIPNMELTGELLDDISYRVLPSGIEVGILETASDLSVNKADNHNKFSSESKKTPVPRRAFIPKKDENFNKFIQEGIKGILAEYGSED